MVIGVLQVELTLPASHSLKDKRRLVKSLLDRLHNEFNVAAAEVDAQDDHRHAHLAVTCVSTDARHANRILSRIMEVVERESEMIVVRYEMELR
ncbi:MAG: DUF503 domain-containing protein [Armatimonadota bacterium]|nr:DUF503 domain-containing protein [Armatimonadota bacterium]MDR7400765.1 DUF503 domain-containing protein [Armatimonadota bacterium]MDR7405122.1 DUF503 domain-containing protein [Armatimonadota bacterium]MDR7436641.1 DUF503 domain-containing protein [Armatimonadota bacterium]MDR7472940.1 DUF503 domain-containing protein [Armatimonadota bacterium]